MSMQVIATSGATDFDQHHDDLPQNGPTSTMAPPAGIVRASLSSILSSGSGIQPGISRLYGMAWSIPVNRPESQYQPGLSEGYTQQDLCACSFSQGRFQAGKAA